MSFLLPRRIEREYRIIINYVEEGGGRGGSGRQWRYDEKKKRWKGRTVEKIKGRSAMADSLY
jgi:hypothetical protein